MTVYPDKSNYVVLTLSRLGKPDLSVTLCEIDLGQYIQISANKREFCVNAATTPLWLFNAYSNVYID